MAYKLIASDMDGTLLNNSGEITQETLKAIELATSKGVLFCISTGRPIQGIEYYQRILNNSSPVICYNGAMIVRLDTKEVLHSVALEYDDAKKIIDLGRKYKVTMCIWAQNKPYTNEFNEKTMHYSQLTHSELILLTNEDEILKSGVTKILWYDDAELLKKLQREIPNNLFNQVTFCTSQPYLLEFFNSKVSKAKAMEIIGEIYNIQREEMIAIGDGYNDLAMIKYAGLGVAMKNAPLDVQKEADYVTDTNENNGVAKVIEKFILID